MATSWPQEAAWPTDLREHATYLSRYLRDALQSIDREKDRPVPPQLTKIMIMGSLSLVLKLQNTPDLHHVHDALNLARTEATATATNTSESLQSIKVGLGTFSRSDHLKRHFQKCFIRHASPTGMSHLSHPQVHPKKNRQKPAGMGEGYMNQFHGPKDMPFQEGMSRPFGLVPVFDGMSNMGSGQELETGPPEHS